MIRKTFPGHSISTEESGELIKDSEYQWIIDPIDGTVNYAHGIPITCVSIAIEKRGEVIMGVVSTLWAVNIFLQKRKGSISQREEDICFEEFQH